MPLTVEPLDERTVPSATTVAPVGPVPPDPNGSLLAPVRAVGFHGQLYFVTGGGLYKSDGTAAGTALVAAVPATDLTAASNSLFFFTSDVTHGERLWTSDGSPAGTVPVVTLPAHALDGLPAPATPVSIGRTLFFTADDGAHGRELWKSDGTAAGTGMVKDINPGSGGSAPQYLTAVGGTLFFTADDGTGACNLWKSDGTWKGTVEVGAISPAVVMPFGLPNVNGTLFFTTWSQGGDIQLWKSDGTTTTSLMHFHETVTGLTNVNGTLFFLVLDGTGGDQVWESDGTPAGTRQVAVAALQDATTGNVLPFAPVGVNGTFFFTALDSAQGNELWASDGTPAGTRLLEAFGPSAPSWPTVVGGTLYFTADDGVHGDELWRTDGTAAGTVMVQDINPGAAGSNPQDLTVVNGALYFIVNAGAPGSALWKVGLSASGAPVAAREGQKFSGVVATFSDADVTAGAGAFTATITWGDGQSSPGTITAGSGGAFTVGGTHTYAVGGSFVVKVTIKDAGGSTVTVNDAATVADAALTAAGRTVTPVTGSAFTGVVASFTDADPHGTASEYTATINWGGGHTSAGTIAADGHGGFTVTGTYTYAADGVYPVGVTVHDAGGSSVTASSSAAVGGVATHFSVGGAAAAVAGAPFAVTVKALDALGNPAYGYAGTVHFASSDLQAGLPAGYTFSGADAGAHTFSVTLKTAGKQTVSVTSTGPGAITGTSGPVTVSPGVATHYRISAPDKVKHGVAFSFTITALDAFGNVATGYLGTVMFTSNDGAAHLPANYAFTAGDGGVHTFAATLNTVGTASLTVTDTKHSTMTRTDAAIKVG
jgi:ELWxxDGT repeat protein